MKANILHKTAALICLMAFFLANFGPALCPIWCHSTKQCAVVEALSGSDGFCATQCQHPTPCSGSTAQVSIAVGDSDSCVHEDLDLRSIKPRTRVTRQVSPPPSIVQSPSPTFVSSLTVPVADHYDGSASLLPLQSLTSLRTVVLLN